MAATWSKDSWRSKPIVQVPDYPNQMELAEVETQLATFPPLVFYNEVERLRERLAGVAAGEGFIFQGGDCAESFEEHGPDNISSYFRVFLQSALVMTFAGELPIVKIGRIAGQFAKPRSSPMEKHGDVSLPSYRGDIINGAEFTPKARIPDPRRMLRAYRQSAATLNFLRAFLQGDYASLKNVHRWGLSFLKGKPIEAKYEQLANEIERTRQILRAMGVDERTTRPLQTTDFYTSHEALLLNYEQALTRTDGLMETGNTFATSAHFLWVGDRTRQLDHAHIEYLRGLYNPIGLKCGPTLEPDDLKVLLRKLNPENEPGRLTLIARFGAGKVEKYLPPLIRAVRKEGRKVIWMCDPMHGNTITASTGEKTRPLGKVREEIERFFAIHAAEGTHPGGVHLEMTGKNVTECIGGAAKLVDADLATRYDTLCDPRLNAEQTLEIAFRVAELLKERSATSAKRPLAAAGE